MGGAAAISLCFAVCYSVFKQLDFRRSLMAAGAGALFSAVLWCAVSEYWHPAVFILLPLAAACGLAAFPLMKAYVAKDDELAQGMVAGAGGLLRRLLKRLTGAP